MIAHRFFRTPTAALAFLSICGACLLVVTLAAEAKPKKESKKAAADPYAEYVWPPPPDEPRIKLEGIFSARVDVEADSKLRKLLIGASPDSPYDRLRKPFAVAIDRQGRILVSDSGNAALIRFNVEGKQMDVFGTQGAVRLKLPLGLGLGADETIYVADAGLQRVVAFDAEGKLVGVWGKEGELGNPTDVAVSPDGKKLYVADSKEHRIVVFEIASGKLLSSFGRRGGGEGEFSFPTSLVFGTDGNLYVVDQINSRIEVVTPSGEFVDEFGALGVAFGNFVRPKDIAIDDAGLIYVTDNAFNNVQLFDADFTLLTFVGEGGAGPGRFLGASGVAVRGDRFAVVDQLGARVQVFRFLKSRAPAETTPRRDDD